MIRHLLPLILLVGCRPETTAMASLQVGYMVDTTGGDRRAILDLWRGYLAERPFSYAATPRWSRAEQDRWPIFDLALPFVFPSAADYARTKGTIYGLAPASPTDSSEYVIRTAFTRPDPDVQGERIVLLRTYATRENGRWVLANALPRLTKDWKRTPFESITYVHPAEHVVDTTKARRSVRLMDSLVTTFKAPPPKPVTYFLAGSPEEVFRIIGIDLFIPGSRAFTVVGNYMVFSGVPNYGEFYAHELTHMVLGWRLPDFGTPPPVDEALALWIGGGREKSWPEIRQELIDELRRNPSWTADKLLEIRPATFVLRLTTTASLLELAFNRGGMKALETALGAEKDGNRYDVVGSVAEALGMSRRDVEAAWRESLLAGSPNPVRP